VTSTYRFRADPFARLLRQLPDASKIVRAVVISVSLLLAGYTDASENTSGQAIELTLRAAPPRAAQGELAAKPPHELAATPATENTVKVLSQKPTQVAPLRHRNPELSAQDLVVVSVNAAGIETSRTIVRDPRLVRGETGESPARLTSREFLYRSEVTFAVTLADPAAVAVRLYKPRWTGTAFVLDLIGEANLPDHG